MDKYRLSLIAISVLAVGILAGGWFLGIQPQIDRTSRALVQTATIMQVNNVQQVTVDALAADNDNLGSFRKELATARSRIPEARSQQDLVVQIDKAATDAGVTVTSLNFDDPVSYGVPPMLSVRLPSTATLVAIDMQLSATGERSELEDFAESLQKATRIMTFTGTSYTGPDEPALAISATTWVLLPANAELPEGEAADGD
ncbi:type 4a pilus biogenesis protein PilO [Microbacterium sp. 179-B 1A2 NHS]|uniref:hypothetical protein n=1 Tax=Microbacterium sp. 179-B 1A2 NHS TaxID=3142383 RepID=UPI0039A27729